MKPIFTLLVILSSLVLLNAQTFTPTDAFFKVLNEELFIIVTADINGDGLDDLIGNKHQNGPKDTLCYWINNGDQSFASPVTIDNQLINISSLEAKDLDNDGDIDILIADYRDRKVKWYENLANLNFSTAQTLYSNAVSTNYLTIAQALDVEGDGDLDILASILASSSSEVKTYKMENLGSGNFNSAVVFDGIPPRAYFFDAKDVTGDGLIDIAVASQNVPHMAVMVNSSLGYQTDSLHQGNVFFNSDGKEVLIHDFDNDGDQDLLGISKWSVSLYRNLSNEFTGESIASHFTTEGSVLYNSAKVADFDEDGDLDFVILENNTGSFAQTYSTIKIFYNNGNGVFVNSRNYSFQKRFNTVDVFDFENDGDQDIIASYSRAFYFPGGYSPHKGVDVLFNHLHDCDTTLVEVTDSFLVGSSYTLIDGTEVFVEGTYTVIVYENECSPTTYIYHLSTYVVNGLNLQTNPFKISLSPNPTKNYSILNFGVNPTFKYDVEVVDISGKLILTYFDQSGNDFQIQNDFQKGTYLVFVYKNGSREVVWNSKLIVQ